MKGLSQLYNSEDHPRTSVSLPAAAFLLTALLPNPHRLLPSSGAHQWALRPHSTSLGSTQTPPDRLPFRSSYTSWYSSMPMSGAHTVCVATETFEQLLSKFTISQAPVQNAHSGPGPTVESGALSVHI